MALTKKQKDIIRQTIEQESFDYCFSAYTSFPKIKDKKFRELLTNFLKSRQELLKYLDLGEDWF